MPIAPRFQLPCSLAAVLAATLAGCGGSSSSGGGGAACQLPAAASLAVVEVTPASGATGVFVGANVSLRFNTCLDPSTIGSTNVLLVQGTSFVASTLSYDPVTATVTLDPAADLAYSRVHLVSATSLRGARGETLSAPFGSSFTTQSVPETVPPTTVASPAGGRYNAVQSVTLTCTDNPGGTGCAATRYTLDGSAPTGASPLYAGPIPIAADAVLRFFSVDVQGNAETPRQETYVIDTVPPRLAASDPPDGASGVALTKVLTATFSEEMDAATLTEGAVTADHGLTFSLAWSAATSTLTLTPTERLVCGTTYQVSLSAAARDLAGNALEQPATFSFSTQADCLEPVTTASPAGGVYTTSPQSVTLSCTDAGGSGCARIVYTTDGSLPSLSPPNGTVTAGASAGPLSIGEGDTTLRWFAEDAAGNREVLREERYSVSTQGFTFVAMAEGIARGVGRVPARFEPILPGGRTRVFVRDPSNGRLYRGTERGLLVADEGEAFRFLPGSWPEVLSVLPQGSKIFAGTRSGLVVSTDGGATWQSRDVGGASWVFAVVAEGASVWAATDRGVAVSTDRGRTFTLRRVADGLGSDMVRALVLSGGALYAGTSDGLSISTDGGATFANTTLGLPSLSVRALVVSGATVYMGTDSGLHVSADGGQTLAFTRTTANGLGSNHVGSLAFDGTRLYACTGEPWVSGTSNTFAVSTDATGATFAAKPLQASHASLRADAVQVEGTTVRVGAFPGYYLSEDGGGSFLSMDLRSSVGRLAADASILYAAIDNSSGHGGLAISTDRGRSFVVRGKDDGIPNTDVDEVAASGPNVYVATFSGFGDSDDGGLSFVQRTVHPSSGVPVECVWASGTAVWACKGTTVNLSTDAGNSFSERLAGLNGPNAVATDGAKVYVSTSNGLWTSPDGTVGSFVQRLAGTSISRIAVDGAGRVLAITGGGLLVSTDSGATFSPVASQISPRALFARGTTWWAVTSSGAAISEDGGASWVLRGSAEGLGSTPNDITYMP